jgi:hypothetical protein
LFNHDDRLCNRYSFFQQIKVGLGDTAIRTFPLFGKVLKPRTGRKSIVGQALRLIIDKSADYTLILPEGGITHDRLLLLVD